MGKFALGFLLGLLLGLMVSEDVFPDGFSTAVQEWGQHIRDRTPSL